MRLGINADPHWGFSTEEIGALNVADVRFPLWQDGFDFNPFIDGCLDLGIEAIGLLDDEAHDGRRQGETWVAFYARMKVTYPNIKRWQILNEVDGLPDGSSGPHPVSVTNSHLWAARRGLGPDAYIIAPSLVQANYAYAKAMAWQHVNSLAFHPYGQAPNTLFSAQLAITGKALGARYWRGWASKPASTNNPRGWGFGTVQQLYALYQPIIDAHQLDVYVPEFGGEGDLFEDEHHRAVYHSEMIQALDALGVAGASCYCYSDLMFPVDGGMGAVDSDGKWKETAVAIANASPPRQ